LKGCRIHAGRVGLEGRASPRPALGRGKARPSICKTASRQKLFNRAILSPFYDGQVETLLNTSPDTPLDLRLNISSDTPPTGTGGTLQEEMDRVWVLCDRGA